MTTARIAAIPNVRIRADSAKENDSNAITAFIAVSRQPGATSMMAWRAASMRLAPAMIERRIEKTRCIESEKPETRISGVSTLMKRLRRKSSPPITPSVHRIAIDGPSTAISVSERRPKKR